jgi:hypothetical protein
VLFSVYPRRHHMLLIDLSCQVTEVSANFPHAGRVRLLHSFTQHWPTPIRDVATMAVSCLTDQGTVVSWVSFLDRGRKTCSKGPASCAAR